MGDDRRVDVQGRSEGLPGVQALRERARQDIEQGAVTGGYTADRETFMRLLNEAMTTAIVSVLHDKRPHDMAEDLQAQSMAAEFLQHAVEQQAQADLLTQRIVQLGGEPDRDPDRLSAQSHTQCAIGKDMADMIRENLMAKRIAIDSYGGGMPYLGDDDPTTRRILEDLLASEEERADYPITPMRGQSP